MTCNNYSIAVKEWQQGTCIHSSCTVEVHTLSLTHTHTLSFSFYREGTELYIFRYFAYLFSSDPKAVGQRSDLRLRRSRHGFLVRLQIKKKKMECRRWGS